MEITFHTFLEKQVSYTQLLGPKGEILISAQLTSDVGELQNQLMFVCEKHGGQVFRDKNHFGEFMYLNGPNINVYQDVISDFNSI